MIPVAPRRSIAGLEDEERAREEEEGKGERKCITSSNDHHVGLVRVFSACPISPEGRHRPLPCHLPSPLQEQKVSSFPAHQASAFPSSASRQLRFVA